MKILQLAFATCILFSSCKTPSGGNHNDKISDPDKAYKLKLNPQTGNVYNYEVETDADIAVELDGKTIHSTNNSDVELAYDVARDSAGNILLTMTYDKIHIQSNKNGQETEADAANGTYSLNPIDRMVAILKEGRIVATVTDKGEVVNLTGYKEIGDRILAGFDSADEAGRKMAAQQWEKSIGQELVRKSMDQMFAIFPDSTVRLGDTWNLTARQEGEFSIVSKGHYKLKAINEQLAIIESEGKLTTSNGTGDIMGLKNVVANLEGTQEGQFEMETASGMLMSCTIKAKLSGTLNLSGREIPVIITSNVKMMGRKK